MKNILVLSAGRRVELVQAFQKEAKTLGGDVKVFTTDLNPELSSACQVSDKSFLISRANAPIYSEQLKDICLQHNIGLVIPTIDTELLPLAKAKEDFLRHEIIVIVSDLSIVQKCRDKRLTGELFSSLDVGTPQIYNKDSIQYPCFVKPYDGSSSIGAMKALTKADISSEVLANPKMMFMEYIEHGKFSEYTTDLYFDRRSQLQCLVPRRRIETRSGEVSKGVTRKNFLYDYLKSRFQFVEGAIGCLTLQVFFNEDTEKVYGIEINPRFGGGYPLAYAAGARYPQWLLQEYFKNESLNFFDKWEENLLMLRYDAKVLTHGYN